MFKGHRYMPIEERFWAQVREIRALWETGRYTKRGLGRQFSVSDTIIYKVVTRQLWAHVEDGGQDE